MVNVPQPMDPQILTLVRERHLRRQEVMDLVGCGAVRAQTILNAAGTAALPDTGYLELPLPDPTADRIVAVVPSAAVARETILYGEETGTAYGFYHRDCALKQPIRQGLATHIATDIDGIVYAWEIKAHGLSADGSVRPRFADKAIRKATKHYWQDEKAFLSYHWPREVDTYVLGERLPDISVPLGFAGKGGIAGVRHVRLDDLAQASVYKGLPGV